MDAEQPDAPNGNGAAAGNGAVSSGARKRVRFQDEAAVYSIPSNRLETPADVPDAKRTAPLLGERGPAWPAGVGRARHVTACADDTMMAPDVAASKRAQMRSRMHGGRGGDGDDDAWELEGAEEDYEEPEELYNDAGIPIEPFHMRKEREEGYFDEDGNYIEYRLQDIDDAWLDSLQDDQNAVDAALAARLAVRGAASLDEQADEPPAMDSDDAAIYKRRVVDLLRPGETVLRALRRLGGMQQHPSSPRAHKRAVRKSKQPHSEDASDAQASPQQHKQPRGAGQSSPMAISGSNASAHPPAASSPVVGRSPPGSDAMAATPPTPAAVVAAAAASLSAGASGPSSSSGQRSAQGPASSGAGPSAARGRMSAEDSIPFDKLTEYADLLLGSGDFGIYEASREQLLLQLQATSLQDSLVEDTVGSVARRQDQQAQEQQRTEQQMPAAPAVDADVDMFGGEDEQDGSGDAAAAGVAAAAAASAKSEAHAANEAIAGSSSSLATAGSDAAMTDVHQEGPQTTGAQPSAPSASAGEGDESQARQGAAAASATALGTEAAGSGQAGQLASGAAAKAGGSGAPSGLQSALEGFVFDDQSGFYFNSSLGYYYSPETCLFGDSSTGQWYRYHENEGRYELAT